MITLSLDTKNQLDKLTLFFEGHVGHSDVQKMFST